MQQAVPTEDLNRCLSYVSERTTLQKASTQCVSDLSISSSSLIHSAYSKFGGMWQAACPRRTCVWLDGSTQQPRRVQCVQRTTRDAYPFSEKLGSRAQTATWGCRASIVLMHCVRSRLKPIWKGQLVKSQTPAPRSPASIPGGVHTRM